MIKRLTINLLIIFMIFMGVIYGYTESFSLSKFDRFSYASADNWSSCDSSDLVTAFRYYCKSRNLAIEGSVADALTSFTTTTFNNLCSTVGIDPTTLQAELKKTTDGNLGLRFLFSNSGITAYNRLFSEFLQNNDLAVGDNVDELNVFSGEYYADGNCMIYQTDQMYTLKSGNPYSNSSIKMGTPFVYDKNDFISNRGTNNTLTVSAFGVSRNFNIGGSSNYQGSRYYNFSGSNATFYETISGNLEVYDANVALIHLLSNDSYYIGYYCYANYNSSYGERYSLFGNGQSIVIPDNTLDDADVNLTTNNTTINNNSYNYNYTIIYNDGDHYGTDDDNEPDPDTPPEGGGGGDDPGGDPDPTPSGPDSPDWQPPHGTGTIGSDGTFDFDLPFSLPNLNIDWSLKDIGHKFPFCIPGDIVSFYQTLAVEPRAPSIDAHIPLGSFYDWHFVADFSQYDRWAVIIRAVEYVGFVIGLIYFTVRMVKG